MIAGGSNNKLNITATLKCLEKVLKIKLFVVTCHGLAVTGCNFSIVLIQNAKINKLFCCHTIIC